MLRVVTAAPAKQTGQEQLLMVTPTMTVYATLTKSVVAPIQQRVTTMRALPMTMVHVRHLTPWAFVEVLVLRMLTETAFAMIQITAPIQLHVTTAMLPMKPARACLALVARLYKLVTTMRRQQLA
jgi:hypothetical protein